MFGGFVVFFRCLGFLGYRFSGSFVVLFSGLGFLRSGWFSFCFFVFFSGLGFLLCSWFCRGFMMFFMMGGLGSSAVGSSRRLSGAYCVSSESGGRETHSSGNDQS